MFYTLRHYAAAAPASVPPSDADLLTSKGLTDAQIQLISGHESKKSLEVYRSSGSARMPRAGFMASTPVTLREIRRLWKKGLVFCT
jgi:hypothetical protein